MKTYSVIEDMRPKEITLADGEPVPSGARLIGDAAPPNEAGEVAVIDPGSGAILWTDTPPAGWARAVAGVQV